VNYPVVKLSAIADVRLGRQRSPKNHSGSQMRPYLRAANVGWEGLKLDDVKTMNFTDAEMATYSLRPGDLLLAEASGSPGEVGKPALWSGELDECAFQNTLIRVRPRGADSRYLLHFFRHQARLGAFAAGSRGAGINHLGQAALAGWPVPAPPLAVQQRIVAILDQADFLTNARATQSRNLDPLVSQLFDATFERGGFEARRVALADVAAVSGGKRLPKGEQYADGLTAHPYIRVADLRGGGIEKSDLRYLTPEVHQRIARYVVAPGDVVISIAGSIGLVAPVPSELAGANLTENAARIRPRRADDYHPVWLAAMLRSTAMQAQIASHVGQVTIGKLALFRIEKLSFNLPPLDAQQRFVRQLDALRAQESLAEASMGELQRLHAALQAQAFSGQL
jgi:type I restriction enzyme S subunit